MKQLAQTLNSHDRIQLIPNTGVQFIDLAFSLPEENWQYALGYTALREPDGGASGAAGADERSIILVENPPGTTKFVSLDGQPVNEDYVFKIHMDKILESTDKRWFPLPYLRQNRQGFRLDAYPTNWVRSYIFKLDEPGPDEETHRLVLAVDTTILSEEKNVDTTTKTETKRNVAPTEKNVSENSDLFRFAVGNPALPDFLLKETWLQNWAQRTCAPPSGRRLRMPEVVSSSENEEEEKRFLEHYPTAIYYAYLHLLKHLVKRLPDLHFLDTSNATNNSPPIPVDVVLDVGNSRTCGIIFEQDRNKSTFDNCYSMTLRDLSSPGYVHDGPFSSRMEFVDHAFGDEYSSNISRQHAFRWPSIVRLGPEAERLAGQVFGNEGNMGLSSPKRYIWDTRPSTNTWYLNPNGRPLLSKGIVTEVKTANKGDFILKFTQSGERQSPEDPYPPITPRYSPSSMMTFFLAELFLQAFHQINAPHVRYTREHANRHRYIRHIILTVPTAMTIEERILFQRRARDAQAVLWDILYPGDVSAAQRPELSVTLHDKWDEAVATQAVFLYNETSENFSGDMENFFAVSGRVRAVPAKLTERLVDSNTTPEAIKQAPSLRIASLDIGGGTTDLIVTTYYHIGGMIIPNQNFREGFNIAGDDILGDIVQKLVLPQLVLAMKSAGHPEPLALLDELVGKDGAGANVAADHNMRRQIARHLLIPTAIRLIEEYESVGLQKHRSVTTRLATSLINDQVTKTRIDQHIATKNNRLGFPVIESPLDLDLTFRTADVEKIVLDLFETVVSNLAEIVYAYDCDDMLLSGRPSRMPAIRNLLLRYLPIAPHRLCAMHDYVVGDWYPIKSLDRRVEDPKTTVSVGAMVCALSLESLEGFHIRTEELNMRSTVRHIGVIHKDTISDKSVLFTDVDLDDEDEGDMDQEAEYQYSAPVRIGFRQMKHSRWQATPYYEISFKSDTVSGNDTHPNYPFNITLKIKRPSEKSPNSLSILSAYNASGKNVKNMLDIRLHTLSSLGKKADKHWLDNGIFDTREVAEMVKLYGTENTN